MSDNITTSENNKDKFENLLEFPKYIEIETVNACNARCPMCTINDWDELKGEEIVSPEFAEKVSIINS